MTDQPQTTYFPMNLDQANKEITRLRALLEHHDLDPDQTIPESHLEQFGPPTELQYNLRKFTKAFLSHWVRNLDKNSLLSKSNHGETLRIRLPDEFVIRTGPKE